MQRPTPRRSGLIALGASVAVLAAFLPASAQAAPRPVAPEAAAAASASASASKAGPTRTVTLITGDKVTLTGGTGGRPGSFSVQRPPGAAGSVRTVTEGGDTYVYPGDAAAYVAADRLDKRLFDVTQLIAQGYDDQHAPRLPLIVSYTKPGRQSRAAAVSAKRAALPGTVTTLDLPSINGAALTADRGRAAGFWSALTADTGSSGGLRVLTTGDAPSFAGGVEKVWLDGRTKADLADTTAQIGAPQVWAGGNTGAGVKVAILDTGVDTGHPDLQGRITDTRSFIPDEDVTDLVGHGTHTASTIVGTGAASGGKEKGVAPGADLVVGKVLDNTGQGDDSWVIAGMEWAAATEHAKVISMSLTDPALRDGKDPISQSVNALSAQTGSLFVVAAGNAGPTPYSVSAPGVADAALTVGAVDTSDELAFFSSQGPRLGDDALKPDLTAPGVDVLAARSQYAGEGEGYYTTMSGTSMATPHVAGSAALLAAAHPDWTGQQLKDALMSSTKETPSRDAYEAGTGRTDVAAATGATVFATGSAYGGFFAWPHDKDQPADRTITYTNTAASPTTLHLAVDAGQAPAGLFTLSADQVTVPAKGTASVHLRISPGGVAPGRYTGQVAAHDAAGALSAHTSVGVSIETENYDLTLTAKDREGRPMSGVVGVGRDDSTVTYYVIPESGTLTVRTAPGAYSVMMYAEVRGTHGPHSRGVALLGDPEVDLHADATVALDASRAREVRALTPRKSFPARTRIEYYRSFTSARPAPDNGALVESILLDASYDSVWAQPSDARVTHGSFAFTTRWRAEQAPLDVSYGATDLDDVLAQEGSSSLPDGTSQLKAVYAGDGSAAGYAGLSARGTAAVVRRDDAVSPSEQSAAARAAGVKLLLVVNDGVGRLASWYGAADGQSPVALPVASLTGDEGEALISRIGATHQDPVKLRVESHPSPAYLYDLDMYQVGAVPKDLTYRADSGNLARVDTVFGQAAGTPATESRVDQPPYTSGAAFGFGAEPVAPGPRTDWVSAGGAVSWQQAVQIPGLTEQSDFTSYRPGAGYQERWLSAVMRPRMLSGDLPVRSGDLVSATVPGWGDSGLAHAGYADYGTALRQTVSFYQGDDLLDQADYPFVYATGLSPEPLPYRIVADTTNGASFSPYSTRTHTEWDFTSRLEDENTLATVPLLQLDYGIPLDAAGRAGRTARLGVSPSVPGDLTAGAASVRLEISYDDGANWQRQKVTKSHGTWQTSLNAPRPASFVSLRATAEDTAGGSVTQTVIRAFGLK